MGDSTTPKLGQADGSGDDGGDGVGDVHVVGDDSRDVDGEGRGGGGGGYNSFIFPTF